MSIVSLALDKTSGATARDIETGSILDDTVICGKRYVSAR